MNSQWLIVKQLDRQLREWQNIAQKYTFPIEGWVKTLRKALGMTSYQLGKRLGLSQSRVIKLEEAERSGGITIATLKRIAEAMNSDFVYAIVPKKSLLGEKPLENMIIEQSNEISATAVFNVAHSMSLEDQSIDKKQQEEQQKELAKKLLEGPFKKLWKNK